MRLLHNVGSLAGVLPMAGWSFAQQRASSAHYMLGTITAEHARKDIEAAKATGFAGFALNVGDPAASFIDGSLSLLFDAAESVGGFGLYISMDLMAGDRLFNLFDWSQVLEANYRTRDYWCDLVDGAFSWESAWPEREGYGGKIAGDVSPDFLTAAAAHNHSKLYMVPLSPIQYKNSYKTNVYRPAASFNHAFKNRLDANSMTPQNGAVASIVLKPGLEPGYTMVIHSGDEDNTMALSSGINYNNGAGNIKAGVQSMEIKDPSGRTIMTARSKYCVSSGCPQGIYNMNYLVSPFEDGTNDADCKSIGAQAMPITSDLDAPVCGDDKNDWTCIICDTTKVTLLTPASEEWSMGKTDVGLEDFAALWKGKTVQLLPRLRVELVFGYVYVLLFRHRLPMWKRGNYWPLAGSFILISMSRINTLYNAWLSAVAEATSNAQDMKNTFIDTFAYDPSKDVATQLNSWSLSQVFDVVGGQAFSGLSRIIGESEAAEGA
ncbi:hypothetical protein CaCOL14_010449 [Colletotrichum acutatum]